MGIVKQVRSKADLTQIVATLNAPRRLACMLHRRKQERDQHADHGDHDQKLYEREAAPCRRPLTESQMSPWSN
jgi:hypothetical protein